MSYSTPCDDFSKHMSARYWKLSRNTDTPMRMPIQYHKYWYCFFMMTVSTTKPEIFGFITDIAETTVMMRSPMNILNQCFFKNVLNHLNDVIVWSIAN